MQITKGQKFSKMLENLCESFQKVAKKLQKWGTMEYYANLVKTRYSISQAWWEKQRV